MHVLFRADATSQIGGGHIFRCLTLAGKFAELGHRCTFFCSKLPEGFASLIADGGHDLAIINSQIIEDDLERGWEERPANPELQKSDQQACAAELGREQAGLVVVDHYLLDASWEQAWSASRILAIDDLANRQHDCDFLLDQTLGRTPDEYSGLIPASAIAMTGTSYALLRSEFAELRQLAKARRAATEQVNHILVNFGSADIGGLTLPVLQNLIALDYGGQTTAVCGSASKSKVPLEEFSRSHEQIELIFDSKDMARLMLQADLAIGAPGATSWERCALGLPSVLIGVAENQRKILEELARHEIAAKASDPGEAARLALQIADDPEQWQRMSSSALALCDGRGAGRVVQKVTDTLNK